MPTREHKGFQLESFIGTILTQTTGLNMNLSAYKELRESETSKYDDRSDPLWRFFYDPSRISGRYAEIFGQLHVDSLYQNVSWTLYDKQEPDRPRNQNPYILPFTRQAWERGYENRFYRLRDQLPTELKRIERRIVEEPASILGVQPAKLVAVHPYADIGPSPPGTLPPVKKLPPTLQGGVPYRPSAKPTPVDSLIRFAAYALSALGLYLIFLFLTERYSRNLFRLVVAAAFLAGARFLLSKSSRRVSGS